MIKISIFLKSILLFLRPHVWLGWAVHPLRTLSNLISLSKWISVQKKKHSHLNDFFSFKRDYNKRLELYKNISEKHGLREAEIIYLEFGVWRGDSFKWWLEENKNARSNFFGFDTFEGLPENWGPFSKGDMHADVPEIGDSRSRLYKGLFQHTLPQFIQSRIFGSGRKIIHLDADLYSSTLYVLTTLYPYLKKGDIFIFDEFNVPNHEYLAFKNFVESFYVDLTPIGAVNNYFQVAFIVN